MACGPCSEEFEFLHRARGGGNLVLSRPRARWRVTMWKASAALINNNPCCYNLSCHNGLCWVYPPSFHTLRQMAREGSGKGVTDGVWMYAVPPIKPRDGNEL